VPDQISSGPLIAVLDYGIGNLRSAQKALQHVGADARLTADPGLIREARAVVLPGVGSFGACMAALRLAGLADITSAAALDDRPFLGVCVGMQMLFEGSDESPEAQGLGIVTGRVRLIPGDVKRPQMQWNLLESRQSSPLIGPGPQWMYFVHSYAAECDPDVVVATCNYGSDVVAMIDAGHSCWATQFHPEKSAHDGLALLTAFVELAGATADDGGQR